MAYVALVTLLLLSQYFFFTIRVGQSRGEIKAPAMTGSEEFERKLRVQLNTLEQLIIAIPAMWICAHYFSANVAAILGVGFFIGRALFSMAYTSDPTKRAPGMILGVLSYAIMIGCSLYGIIGQLL